MSEVISFRLDQDNPREAQALEIIGSWCAKGYSVRYTITEALLVLDHPESAYLRNSMLEDIKYLLQQIDDQLSQNQIEETQEDAKRDESIEQSRLTDSFVISVTKAVKSGLKTDPP